MDIPESFKPKTNLDEGTEKLLNKKYKKIVDIKDLILDSKEIGKDYHSLYLMRMRGQEFKHFFGIIEWHDIEDNIKRMYEKPDYDKLTVYVLEYLDQGVLEENLYRILYEVHDYNKANLDSFILRALCIDKYALILNTSVYNKKDLDRVENIYKQRFGAKVLQREDSTK